MRGASSIDPVTLNLWYPIVALCDTTPAIVGNTVLLEQPISFAVGAAGETAAWKARADLRAGDDVDIGTVGTAAGQDCLWLCLDLARQSAGRALSRSREYAEPDRRNIAAASIGVNVSAPRAIENFLDMGHFPYVHTDILGVEPHTEVKEYDVEISVDRDEILATRCRFFQPMASTAVAGRRRRRICLPRAASLLLGALQVEPARREAAWTSSPSSCSRSTRSISAPT